MCINQINAYYYTLYCFRAQEKSTLIDTEISHFNSIPNWWVDLKGLEKQNKLR